MLKKGYNIFFLANSQSYFIFPGFYFPRTEKDIVFNKVIGQRLEFLKSLIFKLELRRNSPLARTKTK